jgi:integrase
MPKSTRNDGTRTVQDATLNARIIAASEVAKARLKVWRAVPVNKIHEEKQPSGQPKFRLLIGYKKPTTKSAKARQIKPSFGSDRKAAENFRDAWNLALQKDDKTSQIILTDVAQIDVRWAIEELAKVNVNLREAVNFYLIHALPEGGNLTIKEAMEVFINEQKARGNSKHSSSTKSTNYKTYYRPLVDFFDDKILIELTTDDVKKYISKRESNGPREWGAIHYNTHISYGSRFWNLLAKLKYCSASLNPWDAISKRKKPPRRGSDKIMSAGDVLSFFWFTEARTENDKSVWQEIALMALNFFCGIRIEEVEKCAWSQIQKNVRGTAKDETKWRITVWGDQEKTQKTKVAPIPECAQFWLALAEKHATRDKIIHDDHKQRMKRLRRRFEAYRTEKLRKIKGNEDVEFRVPANTGRHLFCSMHLGLYNDYPLTVKRLNHGNVNTMRQNYEAVVEPEQATMFFDTLPRNVWVRRTQEQRNKQDAKWEERGVKGMKERTFYRKVETVLLDAWVQFTSDHNYHPIEAEKSFHENYPLTIGDSEYQLTHESVLETFLEAKRAVGRVKHTAKYELPDSFDAITFFHVQEVPI